MMQSPWLGAQKPVLAGSLHIPQQYQRRQSFCADPEGWGPLSSTRYDFTPCFLDVWLLVVAAWGLFGGAGAIWLLLKKRTPQDVQKNWHFYAKL